MHFRTGGRSDGLTLVQILVAMKHLSSICATVRPMKIFPLILCACLLAACTPSQSEIQTAIAKTQIYWTPVRPTIIYYTPVVIAPTHVPTSPSCYQWNQITTAMKDQTVCVQGIVYAVYNTGNSATRITFTKETNTFFLDSTGYVYYIYIKGVQHDLAPGDCVQITKKVQVYNDLPFMEFVPGELLTCP